MTSVSAFGNGLAPRSALVLFEGAWVSPDMAARLSIAFPAIRARGATIQINEGYRWKGVASDRAIGRSGAGPELTSDGTSNQFYQKGREDAGLTPSAATPGFSNHGDGNSVDTNCSDIAIRDEEFDRVGLHRDIASETWHATIYKDSEVPLGSIPTTITGAKDDDMTQAILATARNGSQHYFTVSDQRITHNGSKDDALMGAAVNSGTDEVHNLNADQFFQYTNSMGIPREVIDLEGGMVLDVWAGGGRKGATWSRANELVEKTERIRRKLGA